MSLDLERLESLLAEATDLPWGWRTDQMDPLPPQWSIAPGVLIAEGVDGTPGGDAIDRANAALLIEGLAALPSLIRRIRELEEGLKRIRDRDWVENALDPLWPEMIASNLLERPAP